MTTTLPTTSVDLYPSRQGTRPRRIERQDPVLHGRPADGTLTAEEREAYARDGFLALSGFFSADEIAPIQAEAERMRRDPELHGREELVTEPESKAVRSIFSVHRLSEIIDRLSRHPRILGKVREMLGGDVYIHQSRINFKPGFRGAPFYWHSDFETWHVEDGMPRMRAVSCSIALTPNTEHNGPLMLVPGSHRTFLATVGETPEGHYKKSLKKQEIGVPDEESLAWMIDEGGLVAPTGPAGSVTFFECNTMHGSNSNITPDPRSNVFIVYNSVENALVDPYCGLAPRPQHIANRTDLSPLEDS